MSRYEKKYGKLVGRIGDVYYFLDYVFKHDDGLQGATGTKLSPISKQEYYNRTDPDNIRDRYEDIWRETVIARKTEEGLDDWINSVIEADGAEECAFDTSYWNSDMWTQLRELGFNEEEYPVFECTGGGRCFSNDMQWDEIYDEKLWKLIQKYETHKKVSKK